MVVGWFRVGITCAGSGKGWRAWVVKTLNRVRMIGRAVVLLVLQGVGSLMVVWSVVVGRAQLCGLVREGTVREGALVWQRRVEDEGLVERGG